VRPAGPRSHPPAKPEGRDHAIYRRPGARCSAPHPGRHHRGRAPGCVRPLLRRQPSMGVLVLRHRSGRLHLARFARARLRGLISEAAMAAVLGAACRPGQALLRPPHPIRPATPARGRERAHLEPIRVRRHGACTGHGCCSRGCRPLMDSVASCPAYDPDSTKILCGEKGTAHTAGLYSVKVPVDASQWRDNGCDLQCDVDRSYRVSPIYPGCPTCSRAMPGT
jgi:hypothetical protein